jgi:hypothetical protein
LKIDICENIAFQIEESSIGSFWISKAEAPKLKLNYSYIELDYYPCHISKRLITGFLVFHTYINNISYYDENFQKCKEGILDPNLTYRAVTNDLIHTFLAESYCLIRIERATGDTISKKYPEDPVNCCKVHYLHVYEDKIYACVENAIIIFTKALDATETILIKDLIRVNKIHILNSLACVTGVTDSSTVLQFYNLPEFSLHKEYIVMDCAITVYDNYFIAYNNVNLMIFDSNGGMIMMKDFKVGRPSYMNVIDDQLFICLRDQMRLVRVKLK